MARKRGEKVAVVKCGSYDSVKVDKAVARALRLIDFEFKRGQKVLIKPNVVGAFPKNQTAITTHPVVIEAVCKLLKKKGCKIFIGDSPFTNYIEAFKKSGIDRVAHKYGKLVIFEQAKMTTYKASRVLRKFKTAKIIRDADIVINMPKMKTHMLTKYTGAIKNLYGCIPGGLKQRTHLRARGDKKFSNLLVDIYSAIKPELTIMDAVVGMEGNGPTSGHPKRVGLILASKSGVALDIAAVKIMGLNPKIIFTIKEAVRERLYRGYKINVVGIDKLPNLKFKIPGSVAKARAQRMIRRLFREKPIVVDERKCIKCGKCRDHCPACAIKLAPYPVIDKKKCIRCFCCIEICPQHALSLGK